MPVKLQGVVTRFDKRRGMLIIQNGDGAVALHADGHSLAAHPGQLIRVQAQKAAGWQQPLPEFPFKPDDRIWLTNFSTPLNWGGYYLARIHGYVTAPVSGDYQFWIASKASSELWLSTNAQAEGLRKIAFVPDGKLTRPKEWDKYPTQASEIIHLDAGQPYLVDVLQEHRAGNDNTVAVAWRGPGMERNVIADSHLAPYASTQTNGIYCEYWNDYFLASVQPLTAGVVAASELTVLDPQVELLGEAPFPEPMPLEIGDSLTPAQIFRWCEVRGIISFVARDRDEYILELTRDNERVTLKLPITPGLNLSTMFGKRVHAQGVAEPLFTDNGSHKLGVVWVPSVAEITDCGTDFETLQSIKLVSVGELSGDNPLLAAGRQIHIQGKLLQRNVDRLVVQGASQFEGFYSTNGTAWTPVGHAVDVPMESAAFGGLVVSSFKSGKLTSAEFDSVSGVSAGARDMEITEALPAGKTHANGPGRFLVEGGGTGFGSIFDRVHFYGTKMREQSEIFACVTDLKSPESNSVAGIMIRATTDPRDRFVALTLDSGGAVNFRFRQRLGERDELVNPVTLSLPCWLKLTRTFPTVQVQAGSNWNVELGGMVDLVGTLQWENDVPLLTDVTSLNLSFLATTKKSSGAISDEAVPTPIARVLPEKNDRLRDGTGSIIVRGMVTFAGSPLADDCLVLQDDTAGVLVRLTARFMRHPPHVGERVEFELKSRNEKWPLPLDPNRMRMLGPAQMPEPLSLAAANAQIRRGEYRWVECQGIVQEPATGEGFKLATVAGEIPVWISSARGGDINHLVDALVKIRAVLIYREGKTALFLPSLENVLVLEAAPANPFAVPLVAVDKLEGFAQRPATSHRVKVAGVVTCVSDKIMVVQDRTGGVRLQTSTLTEAKVGDWVEAVGFPKINPGSVALSQAVLRNTGEASMPKPLAISSEDLYAGKFGARVIRVEGELLGTKTADGHEVLELQSGKRVIRAELPKAAGRMDAIPAGSRLQVTGVSLLERVGIPFLADESSETATAAFGILLRNRSDVVVLERPPWWAWKHAALVIGSLCLVLAAAMLWIRYLRGKVARRTRQLNEAMNKLEKETRVSATLAERDRLAGEIHDSIEQGLSAIVIQIESALKHFERPDQARRHMDLAKSMATYSRTEVQNAVWDMQSPMLENMDLPGALQRVTQGISAGDRPHVTVNIDGTVQPLTSTVEHHLLRIAQEAITNAVKHGNPENIAIQLRYQSDRIILAIQDDGSGFVPGNISTSGGHFGLQGMQVRAQKIDATISIDSKVGGGTRIEVAIPCGKN